MQPQIQRKEKRSEWKKEIAAKCASPGFAARRVLPLLSRNPNVGAPSECSVELVRALSTGRVTLRYEVAGFGTVYGKAYHDGSVGRGAYDLLEHLWQNGFGPRSKNQVAEPLGFVAEDNLMLLRQAPGVSLASLLWSAPLDQALLSVRAAAQWLAQFHSSDISPLPLEPPCKRIYIFKLADLLAKVAAVRPQIAPLLLDLLQQLWRLAPASNSPPRFAPLHGQYGPLHVFVSGEATVAIDLDKICLSDPAKDVAIFVYKLGKACLEEGGEIGRARRFAHEFIAEYRSRAPEGLENLPFFRALYSLRAFAKLVRKHKTDDGSREAVEQLYLSAFDAEYLSRARKHYAGFGPTGAGATPDLAAAPCSMTRLQHVDAGGAVPSKAELAEQALLLVSPEFIERYVVPLLGNPPASGASACDAAVVQNGGTGRLTVRYEFDSTTILHAKWCADGSGPRCYAVLKALWEAGLGSASRYQVPQPIAYINSQNLLLMCPAPGKPLGAALEGDDAIDLAAGSGEAARWLARLHRSSLRIGAPETDWDSLKLFRISSRLIKAAAVRPEQLDAALDLMDLIRGHVNALPSRRKFVQTHGDFHHDHVFIAPHATAVIDLDRSCPSDPAKDAGRFVRVLRSTAFKRGFRWKLVEDATKVFLHEYLSQVPGAADTLGCYWAASMFHNLLGELKKDRIKEKETRREIVDFSIREIKEALEFGR